METDMDLTGTLRELHAPADSYGQLQCEGCDHGPEGEPPEWPCRTAELVYTQDEQAVILADFRWWRRWGRDRERRKSEASGWDHRDDMALTMRAINQAMLRQMIDSSRVFERLTFAEVPDGATVTFPKVSGD